MTTATNNHYPNRVKNKKKVSPFRIKLLATIHLFWANLINKIWNLFLNKYLFCLYREISSGNLTNHEKTKQLCSDDDKNEKDGEKNTNDSTDM